MKGFLNSVKNATKVVGDAAAKTKIKGEIALMDREIKTRKQRFGVDAYDTMTKVEAEKKKLWSSGPDESTLQEPYDAAKKEIDLAVAKKEEKQQNIDALDVQITSKAPATNMKEKMSNAGNIAKEATLKTKLKGEIVLIDQEIKSKKQAFGIIMYDLMSQARASGNWEKASDEDVGNCFEGAKSDLLVIMQKRDNKEKELIALGGSLQPAGASEPAPAAPAADISSV